MLVFAQQGADDSLNNAAAFLIYEFFVKAAVAAAAVAATAVNVYVVGFM